MFGRTSCQTPWHMLPPIYLDESGSAYTLLVNPSGGLVGGDQPVDRSDGQREGARPDINSFRQPRVSISIGGAVQT